MLGAETQVGPIAFELLQPLEGPSVYQEWLDEHGEGLHHVACMMHSKAEAAALKQRFDGLGIETLTSGRLGEDLEYYYFDTQPLLKMILETGSGHSKELAEPIRIIRSARASNADTSERIVPFAAAKLDALLGTRGVDALMATSSHNTRYLMGGYRFFLYDRNEAIASSR
jgi:hypothetical protein